MDFWEGNLAWSAIANLNDENTTTQPGIGDQRHRPVSGGTPKWKGIISADYTTGPYSFTVQGRWFGTSKVKPDRQYRQSGHGADRQSVSDR